MSKNKKEKIRYVDDGSTVADMSALGKGAARREPRSSGSRRHRPTFKECWQTYIQSVRMMFFPMLVTMGIITVVFLILWLAYGAH